MEKVTEHTIEHLAKNTSHVLVDNGVMTLDCDYKKVAGEGKIRFDFSYYLGRIRDVQEFDLERLKSQLQHSSDLSFLIHSLDNITMVDSTLEEHSIFVNHLFNNKKRFRQIKKRSKEKLKRSVKQKTNLFVEICDTYMGIYDCLSWRTIPSLSDESSFVKIRKYMEERRLHIPRGRKFVKNSGRTHVSKADLDIVAQSYNLALESGNGVVVISNDMDVINLVYNFGADYNHRRSQIDLNGQSLQQRVSVYYPANEGWVGNLNCKFKANSDGLTNGALRGPWF